MKAEDIVRAGRIVTGIVWGTFWALFLLLMVFTIAYALWPG